MSKKIIKTIILIMILSNLWIPNVNAGTISGSINANLGGGIPGDNTPDPPEHAKTEEKTTYTNSYGNTYEYTCEYDYYLSVGKSTTVHAFNANNNIITPESGFEITKDKILAGTSIGLNIYEKAAATWNIVNTQVYETGVYYYCRYWASYCTKYDDEGECTTWNTSYYPSMTTYIGPRYTPCSGHYGTHNGLYDWWNVSQWAYKKTETYETDYNSEWCETAAINDAKNKAISAVGGPSYTVELPNSNDINFNPEDKDSPNKEKRKKYEKNKGGSLGTLTGVEIDSYGPIGTKTGTYTKTYSYNPNKNTCINRKTGIISYRISNCNNDEITVETTGNGEKYHWHYFVPLNAKSSDNVSIEIKTKGDDSKLPLKLCKAYIDAYWENNEYQKYLLDENKNLFPTNITRKKDAHAYVENGCYLSSNIKIPIEQKFYKEVNNKDKKTLNGFNFYYRPIDVNNPFPNGIENNSLWIDYWNKTTKDLSNIELTNSYSNSNITYYTLINESIIRDYNNEKYQEGDTTVLKNPYTDWSTMTIDGKSTFIDDKNIIHRNPNVSYYKLGCGPQNIDKYLSNGYLNPYYQEECGGKS